MKRRRRVVVTEHEATNCPLSAPTGEFAPVDRMKPMTKLCLVLVAAVLVAACDSGDKAHDRCTRVERGVCATAVRCHAVVNGIPLSSATCDQVLPSIVDQCVQDDGDLIGAASDQAVDGCVAAFEGTACTDVCNQDVENPPACVPLTHDQSTDYITCQ